MKYLVATTKAQVKTAGITLLSTSMQAVGKDDRIIYTNVIEGNINAVEDYINANIESYLNSMPLNNF